MRDNRDSLFFDTFMHHNLGSSESSSITLSVKSQTTAWIVFALDAKSSTKVALPNSLKMLAINSHPAAKSSAITFRSSYCMSTSVAKCTLSNSIAKSGACLETAPFVFTPALTSCATTETNSSLTPPNTAESSVSSFTTLSTNLWPRKNERARGRHARPFFLGPATKARMICL